MSEYWNYCVHKSPVMECRPYLRSDTIEDFFADKSQYQIVKIGEQAFVRFFPAGSDVSVSLPLNFYDWIVFEDTVNGKVLRIYNTQQFNDRFNILY